MRQEHAWCDYGFRSTQPTIDHGLRWLDHARLLGDAKETNQYLDMLREARCLHLQEPRERRTGQVLSGRDHGRH
jgi:hypothetical protein